jgi:hypothetical protein
MLVWDRCLARTFPTSVSVSGTDTEWAWTIRGPSSATDDSIECITRWLAGDAESPLAWTARPADAGGCIRSTERDDGVVVFALENRTLVVSSAGWEDAVRAALRGERERAQDLTAAVRMVDAEPGRRLYAAGTLHRPNRAADAAVGWRETVRNLAVSLRFEDAGLAARVDAETTDLADSLLAAFSDAAPALLERLAALGVPQPLLTRLGVSRRAGVLSWTWAAQRAELVGLARSVAPRWRGGPL